MLVLSQKQKTISFNYLNYYNVIIYKYLFDFVLIAQYMCCLDIVNDAVG